MQKIQNYIDWKKLDNDEQNREYKSWNVYEGEGNNIIDEAIIELNNIYKKEQNNIRIARGIFHGGILVISIDVKEGSKVKLPKFFNGFPIMKATFKKK